MLGRVMAGSTCIGIAVGMFLCSGKCVATHTVLLLKAGSRLNYHNFSNMCNFYPTTLRVVSVGQCSSSNLLYFVVAQTQVSAHRRI